ncbi:Socius [Hexamita inflata]|uniref:Socius n=1 Tax=Hexamita inflata TaxID=28002 RepID=A0AA86RA31_9EUKA|nr:Socius [Hexamita inflata]
MQQYQCQTQQLYKNQCNVNDFYIIRSFTLKQLQIFCQYKIIQLLLLNSCYDLFTSYHDVHFDPLIVLLRRANEENKDLREKIQVTAIQQNQVAQPDAGSSMLLAQKEYIKNLEQQVYCLENFLSQHGLVYVEDEDEPDQQQAEKQYAQIKQQITDLKQEPFKPPHRDILLNNIRKLNQITGARPEFIKIANIQQFKDRTSVTVRFYKNGIYVNRGPFRSQFDDSAVQFVDDIQAGFLPTEFQNTYPDGVQIDAHFEDGDFLASKQQSTCNGQGRELTDAVPHPGMNTIDPVKAQTQEDLKKIRQNYQFSAYGDQHQQIVNSQDSKYMQEKPLDVQSFLNRIPEHKIVNGKIISVREQVAKDLGLQSSPSLRKTILIDKQEESDDENEKATIRIKVNAPKNENNGRNIVLKLNFNLTIKELYEEVSTALGVASGAIKLIKVLGGDLDPCNQTIDEMGLTPNSRLYCKVGI